MTIGLTKLHRTTAAACRDYLDGMITVDELRALLAVQTTAAHVNAPPESADAAKVESDSERRFQYDAGVSHVGDLMLMLDGKCDTNRSLRIIRDAREWHEERVKAAASKTEVTSDKDAFRQPVKP